MTASIRTKAKARQIEDDLYRDDAAATYTWLDTQTDSDNDFVEIDIDDIPTLHDVVEHSFDFSQEGHDEATETEDAFYEAQGNASALQQPFLISDIEADSEMQEKVEASLDDNHANADLAAVDQPSDSAQATPQSLEDVFNLARHEPKLLKRVLAGVACIFQLIAAAALWRAIGNKVVVTELVPPLVYAAIGVVAYLVGMRYLRIHFAQERVNYKDWLLCEQVMVGADNGVMLKARFGTAYLIWEQLLGVAQDNDYYYLLIEATQGFKVPKQGVSDPVLQTKLDDLAKLTKAKALQGV